MLTIVERKVFPVKDHNVENGAAAEVSRRQLVKYAGAGATFVAASPLAAATPR